MIVASAVNVVSAVVAIAATVIVGIVVGIVATAAVRATTMPKPRLRSKHHVILCQCR